MRLHTCWNWQLIFIKFQSLVMIKYCRNSISLHMLMWGWILNVRLQIAQEFQILVDLVILFWTMDEILIKAEELRGGNIIQVFPSCPIRILFYFLKWTAAPPGFVPCVHNPAGTSPVSKAQMRQIAPLVFCSNLTAQIEARQPLLDSRSAGSSWEPLAKNSLTLNSLDYGPSGIEGHPSQKEDGNGNRC